MYILIAILISTQGHITQITTEHSDYTKCVEAKMAVEKLSQQAPYNFVKADCKAK